MKCYGCSIRMPRVPRLLVLAAVPPLAASMVVLALAGVNRHIWNVHFAAIVLALLLVIVGGRARRSLRDAVVAPPILLLSFVGLAGPLLRGGAGPMRWLACGARASTPEQEPCIGDQTGGRVGWFSGRSHASAAHGASPSERKW